MDFDRTRMKRRGHGKYEPLPPQLLPRLWLVLADNPSDSGRVHSDVKRRWVEGDPEVHEKMALLAACAEEGRELFGDAALGDLNLRMINAARSVGAAAKFTGSGGAIVAFCPMGEEQEVLLQDICAAEGFTVVEVQVAPPTSEQG
ncbi:hypothetical protein MNEG_16002 [Monoraphidium neglectum]|uniref:GHMP kinase C-terminal domain-containing protein n=1 Tax=Monoraphidium neglectum TaxID=145388 RepID=A0A0D2LPQ0_9CHLO|nr:hypothetical protein MNEG_16002 [Monoraphidium neglectum]KIY91961.1 hypothetical protein MNEG_16002 [Monoraphidium neglectum]|eukprot:XP_013890981.1 hypothetical protein MNEG_16002 [Monoraphidium neglectum]